MSLGEPRPLTGQELLDFEQSERCHRSWYAQSLLLTIAQIREEHHYEAELTRCQIGELQTRLRWFERTYNTRALAPLKAPKAKGEECPHCSKCKAAKITSRQSRTQYWVCFNCGRTWTAPVPPEQLEEYHIKAAEEVDALPIGGLASAMPVLATA